MINLSNPGFSNTSASPSLQSEASDRRLLHDDWLRIDENSAPDLKQLATHIDRYRQEICPLMPPLDPNDPDHALSYDNWRCIYIIRHKAVKELLKARRDFETSELQKRYVQAPDSEPIDLQRRYAQRVKQICIGKFSKEYRNAVLSGERRPSTPTPSIVTVTKCKFDDAISKWRRALHLWDKRDPPNTSDDNSSTHNPLAIIDRKTFIQEMEGASTKT